MRFDLYFHTLVEKFLHQEAISFYSEGKLVKYTYQELDEYSSKVASYLAKIGVQEGMRVGVFCERGAIYPLAFLACAKIGAIYVPINMRLEEVKIKQIVKNAEIQFLITEKFLLEQATQLGCQQVVSVESVFAHSDRHFDSPKADNPTLYLIYSSGTTNEPKGIPIMQQGMAYWGKCLVEIIKETRPRILGNTSIGFDPHIWEFIMAWSTGGCLCLTNSLINESEVLLQDFILKSQISDATFTPKLFNLLISNQSRKLLPELFQAGLRRLYLTGEALNPQTLKICDDYGIVVYNCFGPSELTFGLSVKEVHQTNVDEDGSVEIGFPLTSDIHLFIRDEMQPIEAVLPLSSSITGKGELLVASPYMTPGYYNNTGLTHSNFFTVRSGDLDYRVYKTEDIVEVSKQRLFYRGRTGDRVKRNSVFINLEEIRVTLNHFFNDSSVLFDVIVLTDANRDYLFVFSSKNFQSQAVCQYIQSRLSKNEVPDYVLCLEDYPLNVNGKSDKPRLKSYAKEYLKKKRAYDVTESFKLPVDLANLEKEIASALFSLLSQTKDDAESFFEDNNKLIREFFTESIDFFIFSSRLAQFFNQDIPAYRLRLLSFRQLQMMLARPYLLKTSCVFLNKKSSENSYLFCVPPVTGDIQDYNELIPRQVPAVLMLAPTLNPNIYQNESISTFCYEAFENISLDEQAESYAACMRFIQQEGSYHVLGWSFGGSLMLALLKTNIKMHNPILIDAPHPEFLKALASHELKEWLVEFAKYMLQQFHFDDKAYPNLIKEICLEVQQLSAKNFIAAFFDKLIGSLKEKASVYLINMMRNAKNNMISIYDFNLDLTFKVSEFSILRSQHGLMGKQICFPHSWGQYAQHLSDTVVANTDHFTLVRSSVLRETILKQISQPDLHLPDEETVLLALSEHIPYLPPSFIERPDVYSRIQTAFVRKDFQGNQRQLVSLVACAGLSGMGKTEMAKYFALNEPGYQYRIWFEAETPSKLYAEYQALGKRLRGIDERSPEELIEYIKRVFNKRKKWLIVYDNVESPADIQNYMPQMGGDVLVTSRVDDWDNKVEIDVFLEEQAISYFFNNSKATSTDLASIKELIDELGRLPLAIAQACAYINRNPLYTVERYLNEFRAKRMHYLADPTMPNFCKHGPVAFTWKMAVEAIAKESKDALFVLNCLPYLYPTEISIEYLSDVFAPQGQKEYVKSTEFKQRCEEAIRVLSRYCLVRISSDKKHIAIHRLVQAVMWENQRIEKRKLDYLQPVLESIFRTCVEKADSLVLAGVALSKDCLQDIIPCYEKMLQTDPDNSFILQALGCCFISSNFAKSEECFLKVIKINPNSSIYFEYGHALLNNARVDEAISALEKSIECTDERTSYFSEMEVNIVHERIAKEIRKNGIITANSRSLSYLYLIYCHSLPEYYDETKIEKYSKLLHDFLLTSPNHFVETFLHEMEEARAKETAEKKPQKGRYGCALQ